jgi:hypothetical protein
MQCNVSPQSFSAYINDVSMVGIAVMEVVMNEYRILVWKPLGKRQCEEHGGCGVFGK